MPPVILLYNSKKYGVGAKTIQELREKAEKYLKTPSPMFEIQMEDGTKIENEGTFGALEPNTVLIVSDHGHESISNSIVVANPNTYDKDLADVASILDFNLSNILKLTDYQLELTASSNLATLQKYIRSPIGDLMDLQFTCEHYLSCKHNKDVEDLKNYVKDHSHMATISQKLCNPEVDQPTCSSPPTAPY